MLNHQSEFEKIGSFLSSSISSRNNKQKEFNPINLIALLLLFISLLFLITLSIILHIQNKSLSKLNSEYSSISFLSKYTTGKLSALNHTIANNGYFINMIWHEIDKSKMRYDELCKQYDNAKRTNDFLKKSKLKSKIITKEDRAIIAKMINEQNPPVLKMVYQASSVHNGDSAQVFHEHCKGIGPFVALIKIENDIRIGGYSTVTLGDDGTKEDDKAFLFNFDDNEKYLVNHPNQAVFYNHILFLSFGSNDLFITDEFFTNRFSYSTFPKTYGDPKEIDQKLKLTKGMKLFNIIEFELYQVIMLSSN